MSKNGTGNPSAEEILSALQEAENIGSNPLRKLSDLQLAKKLVFASMKAKKRGIEFDLSIKKYRSLLGAKRCFYTGVKFIPNDGQFGMSIDRVDNDGGYIDSNVVPCCSWINKLKNNISIHNILLMARGVNKHLAKSNTDTSTILKQQAKPTTIRMVKVA